MTAIRCLNMERYLSNAKQENTPRSGDEAGRRDPEKTQAQTGTQGVFGYVSEEKERVPSTEAKILLGF